MEPFVSTNFIFLDSAKEIWDVVHVTYFMKKNVFKACEVYKDIFSL